MNIAKIVMAAAIAAATCTQAGEKGCASALVHQRGRAATCTQAGEKGKESDNTAKGTIKTKGCEAREFKIVRDGDDWIINPDDNIDECMKKIRKIRRQFEKEGGFPPSCRGCGCRSCFGFDKPAIDNFEKKEFECPDCGAKITRISGSVSVSKKFVNGKEVESKKFVNGKEVKDDESAPKKPCAGRKCHKKDPKPGIEEKGEGPKPGCECRRRGGRKGGRGKPAPVQNNQED